MEAGVVAMSSTRRKTLSSLMESQGMYSLLGVVTAALIGSLTLFRVTSGMAYHLPIILVQAGAPEQLQTRCISTCTTSLPDVILLQWLYLKARTKVAASLTGW